MNTRPTPSKYQQDVFTAIADTDDSLAVNAVAGSGKTTTCVWSLDYIPPGQSVLMLAFNKSIVETLKTKVPAGVEVDTFHAIWFRTFTRAYPRTKVEARKTWKVLDRLYSREDVGKFGPFITKLVGLAKNVGIGYPDLLPFTTEALADLADYHDVNGLDESDRDRALSMTLETLGASNEDTTMVDFDDMLYLPLLFGLTPPTYDVVYIDEAQDTNMVQIHLLKRLVGKRLIAVGDPYQAIYGFRGADSNAMGYLVDAFSCRELPLSISYRCSRSVVELAQSIVPHIESHPDALPGSVTHAPLDGVGLHDAILCRNTAPLISTAYDLISSGRPAKVLGRDIGVGLQNLLKKVAGSETDLDLVADRLFSYRNREVERYLAKGQDLKAQQVNDKVDCLSIFIDNLPEDGRTLTRLNREISSLFGDKNRAVTLATIHKAKGMEWDRVYLLRPDLMPSKWAKRPWQQDQEQNIIYVAYTRAKVDLVLVEGK
jgi:DNA helicase II / ATP-dependent DNA helicase PcrA